MNISNCENCACKPVCYKYNNVIDGVSGWDSYFDEDSDCEDYVEKPNCEGGEGKNCKQGF